MQEKYINDLVIEIVDNVHKQHIINAAKQGVIWGVVGGAMGYLAGSSHKLKKLNLQLLNIL